ncbi:MAG: glycosyl transferase [Flavobacterium sp.]|nr:MAG: glycosyl transferase [Flavobacterium sp.]
MIPRTIHYCWFGRTQKPELVKNCIDSWRKHLPEYDIVEWNETNFDVERYRYSSQAYSAGKFAFVSDVCRLHALSVAGGIYLDTDVEFLKPINQEMLLNDAFTGFEDNLLLSSAIMGSVKNGSWVSDLLAPYRKRSFYLEDGIADTTPNTEVITAFMKVEKGLILNNSVQHIENYLMVYPSEFFSPKSWKSLKIAITDNTYAIHHFAASWLSEPKTLLGRISNRLLGKLAADYLSRVYRGILGR